MRPHIQFKYMTRTYLHNEDMQLVSTTTVGKILLIFANQGSSMLKERGNVPGTLVVWFKAATQMLQIFSMKKGNIITRNRLKSDLKLGLNLKTVSSFSDHCLLGLNFTSFSSSLTDLHLLMIPINFTKRSISITARSEKLRKII